jgi:transposase
MKIVFMKSMGLPSEAEINAAYDQGRSAVLALIKTMFVSLAERIEKLEDQLAKNSSNSGKPPSSDGYEKPAPKSRRQRSGKKSGGQVGHPGSTLKMVAKADKYEVHSVNCCASCDANLKRAKVVAVEKRQVFDLPEVRIQVTEHQAEVKVCPKCQQITKARFPSGVSHKTQYGKRIQGQLAYFHEHQLLPLDRTQETFKDLYGQMIAEGTILRVCEELAQKVEPANEAIKKYLTYDEEVAGFDETGLRIESALHWLHVACTRLLTYYGVHRKRGKEAMDAIGILPNFTGRAIHDGFKTYFKYNNAKHGLCNQHHLRSFDFLKERHPQKWVTNMADLLLTIKTKVESAKKKSKTSLSPQAITDFSTQYDALLKHGFKKNPLPKLAGPVKRGRPKQSFARNLLDHLSDHKEAILAFMLAFDVPFDNNQAERDIRMMKVRQKISGCFRSQHGAEIFCAVRGYISTARKNGQPVLQAIYDALDGQPFIPAFVLNSAE